MKVAVLAPAGMVRDAGTVRLAELELKPTVTWFVAMALICNVQMLESPGLSMPRVQVSEVGVTGTGTVTVAPVAETRIALPAEDAPTGLPRPIADVLPPAPTVIETVATVPFAMVFEFSPVARHV